MKRTAVASLAGVSLLTAGLTVVSGSVGAGAAAAATDSPYVVAVGDIACDPTAPAFNGGRGTPAGCRQQAVADAVRAANPDIFLPLGDIQYIDGRYEAFMQSYDPAFGDLKSITKPIPGNHEYKVPRGAGYYRYFGDAAHQETKGTYSFDTGSWHVLAINSTQCTPSRPCGPGSDMAKWINGDIAAHPAQCVMAMWHHPLWSAGAHGDYKPMAPIWNQLEDLGVDVVLNGHDHLYQRTKPLGQAVIERGDLQPPDVTRGGMVEFVIGTGGEDNYKASGLANPALADAMAMTGTNPNPGVFGAVGFTLRDSGYDFEYLPAAGSSLLEDSGSRGCRSKPAPRGMPNTPRNVTPVRDGDGAVDVSWVDGSTDSVSKVNVLGSSRSCTTRADHCRITGLTNGRTYRFTVTATNDKGTVTSRESDPIAVGKRPGIPGRPTAIATGPGAVAVTWTAPLNDGGLPIDRYSVTGNKGLGRVCTTTGELTCQVAGLAPGAGYSFTVTATNEAGTSPTSLGSTSVTVPKQ